MPFPRLTFDLGDFWQDTKNLINDTILFWAEPKEAPPTVRRITIAHQPLKDVGTFAPEIYELALVRGLKAQQAEDAFLLQNPNATLEEKQQQDFYAALYDADGEAKSAFHLAVLPVIYEDDNQMSSAKIREIVSEELNNRIAKDQPLPPTVYKYLTKSDYLKNSPYEVLGPRDITVEIQNPADKTRLRDRFAHYVSNQPASLVLTLVAALAVTASTPFWFVVASMGVLLAKWCGEAFGTFGITEILLRDYKSLFSKEFALGDKISFKKTIKTAVLLASVGALSLAAFSASWAGVFSLPVWGLAQTGVAATLLTGLSYVTAGFVSGLGAIMTFAGAKEAIHFFWGVGIWDKHIDFSKEKQLAPLTKVVELRADLAREEKKLAAECELAGHKLDAQESNQLHAYMVQLETFMAQKLTAPVVEATPAPTQDPITESAPSNVVAFDASKKKAQEETSANNVAQEESPRRSPRLKSGSASSD